VAESNRHLTSAAGADLHARIQEQIKLRRSTGQPAHRHLTAPAGTEVGAGVNGAGAAGEGVNGGGVNGGAVAAPVPAPAPGAAGTGLGRRIGHWVLLLVVTALVVLGLRTYVIASYYIPSASMEQTLHGCPGCQPDLVLVDKLSYRFSAIGRQDVIVFKRPPLAPAEDKQLIKRVIGLPGETVSGRDGHVFVDNRMLTEPYVNPTCHGTADFAAVTVPAGRYFVMGDNRCDSFDSRMFGTIPRSAVIGRAFAVVWPVHHLRWL